MVSCSSPSPPSHIVLHSKRGTALAYLAPLSKNISGHPIAVSYRFPCFPVCATERHQTFLRIQNGVRILQLAGSMSIDNQCNGCPQRRTILIKELVKLLIFNVWNKFNQHYIDKKQGSFWA